MTAPTCETCKWLSDAVMPGWPPYRTCTLLGVVSGLGGTSLQNPPHYAARHIGGSCGPSGTLWQAKEEG